MRGSASRGEAGRWGARARARAAEAVAVAAAAVLVGGVVAVAEDRSGQRADERAAGPGSSDADRLAPDPVVPEEALPGFALAPALPGASPGSSPSGAPSPSASPVATTSQTAADGADGEDDDEDDDGGTRIVVLAVAGPSRASVGETVTFRVTVRTSAGTPVLTGARFGDGAEGGTPAPCAGTAGPAFRGDLVVTHTYASPGAYEPYFVATVPCGPSSGAGTSVQVGDGSPAPSASPTPSASPSQTPQPTPTTSPAVPRG